jgi:hypothetical protein
MSNNFKLGNVLCSQTHAMIRCLDFKKILLSVQLFGLRGVQVIGFSYLSFELKQEQSSEGHAVSTKLRICDAF